MWIGNTKVNGVFISLTRRHIPRQKIRSQFHGEWKNKTPSSAALRISSSLRRSCGMRGQAEQKMIRSVAQTRNVKSRNLPHNNWSGLRDAFCGQLAALSVLRCIKEEMKCYVHVHPSCRAEPVSNFARSSSYSFGLLSLAVHCTSATLESQPSLCMLI